MSIDRKGNSANPKKSSKVTILGLLVDEDGDIKWNVYQGAAILAGVVILVFFTMQGSNRLQSLAIGLLVAGAALAAGILIGFLFGIPRTLQREGPKDTANGNAPGEAYGVNTNLEQISDWLTKIIVGVGLVQLGRVPEYARRLGDYFSTCLGNAACSPA